MGVEWEMIMVNVSQLTLTGANNSLPLGLAAAQVGPVFGGCALKGM